MPSHAKQRIPRQTRRVWKQVVHSAAFCLLLFTALTGGSSVAAESTYHLVGTIESRAFTGAVILTPDGQQSFYRLRETLPDGAQLVQVHSDSISVKGPDGSRYEIFITAAGKLQTASAPGTQTLAQPPAPSPADKDRQSRSSRRGSRRPSSSEE